MTAMRRVLRDWKWFDFMTMTPPGTDLPRWRAIAGTIEREIRTRPLSPGEQLETESVLATRFGVNRHTVRQAVQHLAHAGVVRIERGRGTFVVARAIAYPIGPRTRFSEIMLAQGLEADHEIETAGLDKATAEEARHLRLRTGALVARIATKSLANGFVVTVARNVFPAARLPGVIACMEQTRSITATFAAFGHKDYRRAWTHITAELPDETLARQLASAPSRPILVTHAMDAAADGTPLRFGVTAFAGDLCRLVVEGARPADAVPDRKSKL